MGISKQLLVTLCTCTIPALLLSGGDAYAGEDEAAQSSLNDIVVNGDFSGTIKTLYFARDYDDDTPDWSTLAIGGNIVTAWSWFGTNELGIGLHSYGFTSGVLMWLSLFVLSQVAFILVDAFVRMSGIRFGQAS